MFNTTSKLVPSITTVSFDAERQAFEVTIDGITVYVNYDYPSWRVASYQLGEYDYTATVERIDRDIEAFIYTTVFGIKYNADDVCPHCAPVEHDYYSDYNHCDWVKKVRANTPKSGTEKYFDILNEERQWSCTCPHCGRTLCGDCI